MKRRIITIVGVIIVIAIILGAVAYYAVTPPPLEKVSWRLGTSKLGTFGYATASGVAKIVMTYEPELFDISVVPTPGSVASTKMFGKGELDSCYSSSLTLKQAWTNTGPFEKEPLKRLPYQTIYLYTAEYPIMTLAERDDINTLKDLIGKKVFLYPAGMGAHDMWDLILKKLGYRDKITHVEIDMMAAPDMLKTRVVDAVVVCTVATTTPNAYTENLITRADLKYVKISPEERKAIEELGIVVVEFSKEPAYAEESGVPDKIVAPAIPFGYHVGKNMKEEYVYRFVKCLVEHTDELVEVSAGFKQFAKDPVGFIVKCIDSAPEVPVHPGTVKYLKEKGVWKETWKVGEL